MKALFTLILVFLVAKVFADTTTGAEILRVRMAARPAAMGDAYTALGNDVVSGQFNPAGLQGLQKTEISFLHWKAVAGVSYDAFAYAQSFKFGSLGTSLGLRSMPDIDNPLALDNPVSASDIVVALSYAVKPYTLFDFVPAVLEEAAFGFSAKYLNSKLGDNKAAGVAVDLGMRMPLPNELLLGIALLNLGPSVTFISVSDPLPATATLGVARIFAFGKYNRLSTAADLEIGLTGETRIHLGMEDWIARPLALRVGYILEDSRNVASLSMGMGLKLDQGSLTMNLDYAYKPFLYAGFSSFEGQHLVSAMLRF